MNITNTQMQKVLELHLHKVYSIQETASVSSTSKLDELVLSPKVQDLQDVKEAINALPDIRTHIVRDLKSKIESGSYEIDELSIAESMVSSVVDGVRRF